MPDLDHGLGTHVGLLGKTRAETAGEDDDLHSRTVRPHQTTAHRPGSPTCRDDLRCGATVTMAA